MVLNDKFMAKDGWALRRFSPFWPHLAVEPALSRESAAKSTAPVTVSGEPNNFPF